MAVAYATDRERTTTRDVRFWYGTARGHNLRLGIARVMIPTGQSLGSGRKKASLLTLEERNIDHITSWVLQNDVENLCVLIHGYATTFEHAVKRAAILQDHLPLDARFLAYSWPSRENMAAYPADEATISESTAYFIELIDSLVSREVVVSIVAHSMGSRAVVDTLFTGDVSLLSRVDQVAFAAPDVDRHAFTRRTLRGANHVGGVTLYAAAKDTTLWVSGALHLNGRAGSMVPEPLLSNHFETIDASAAPLGFLGHSYLESPSILKDLGEVLSRGTPASRRGLESVTDHNQIYWRLRG